LRQHLLPRILSTLRSTDSVADIDEDKCNPNGVLFKHDRIYRHNLFRINYTTYDVRRSQDVVNASASHHNIMVLADTTSGVDSSDSDHPFRYARVLGIYHANVLYVGHGMVDYQSHRMEFLWVRWYENTGVVRNGWEDEMLDCIKFPPMAMDHSFGFVDPSDVLRGCHVIPRFARGKLGTGGKGLSRCARDSEDWVEYYVNR
jgi:hypothetical protein